jgi:hypothetical protein
VYGKWQKKGETKRAIADQYEKSAEQGSTASKGRSSACHCLSLPQHHLEIHSGGSPLLKLADSHQLAPQGWRAFGYPGTKISNRQKARVCLSLVRAIDKHLLGV